MTATRTQFRRGTAEQHQHFIGAPGEVTVDTDHSSLRVHDGVLAGGREVLMEQRYKPHDNLNWKVIMTNYTDGFFTNVSKNMFAHILNDWYWRNNDVSNTYLTRDDWKNGIYVCFTTFLSGDTDGRLDTLTAGVA